MKKPTYVRIFCAEKIRKDSPYDLNNRMRDLGRCFAHEVDGRWRCCCCGRAVSVTW